MNSPKFLFSKIELAWHFHFSSYCSCWTHPNQGRRNRKRRSSTAQSEEFFEHGFIWPRIVNPFRSGNFASQTPLAVNCGLSSAASTTMSSCRVLFLHMCRPTSLLFIFSNFLSPVTLSSTFRRSPPSHWSFSALELVACGRRISCSPFLQFRIHSVSTLE